MTFSCRMSVSSNALQRFSGMYLLLLVVCFLLGFCATAVASSNQPTPRVKRAKLWLLPKGTPEVQRSKILQEKGVRLLGLYHGKGWLVSVEEVSSFARQLSGIQAVKHPNTRPLPALQSLLKQVQKVPLSSRFALPLQPLLRPEWKRPHICQLRKILVVSSPGTGMLLADHLASLGMSTIPSQASSDRRTRWSLSLSTERLPKVLRSLSGSPYLDWIEEDSPREVHNDPATACLQSGTTQGPFSIWLRGIIGKGEIIAVADTGLDTDACQFRYGPEKEAQTTFNKTQPPKAKVTHPKNKVITYYVLGKAEPYDASPGKYHGTHTAGVAAGDNFANVATPLRPGHDTQDGMAPGAQLVFQDIGDHKGYLVGLQAGMLDILTQAYLSGARIHNNSFGSVRPVIVYQDSSRQIDEALWRYPELVVVFSAGNSGTDLKTLTGGGSTSKNTIVAGATMTELLGGINALSFFSSCGPTSDGRIKPDLLAPGIVRSANVGKVTRISGKDRDGKPIDVSVTVPPDNNCNVDKLDLKQGQIPVGGTSYSAPLVAGTAALVREYFRKGFYPSGASNEKDGFVPTGALIKAMLIMSTAPMTGRIMMGGGLAPSPSPRQGWGRVFLERAMAFTGQLRQLKVFSDIRSDGKKGPYGDKGVLKTGKSHTYSLKVHSSKEDLVVVLSWYDPPGRPGAGKVLVNNLDLEMKTPDGKFYRGNIKYEKNYSQPVAETSPGDVLNPVEVVRIKNPPVGEYSIVVKGADIPGTGSVISGGPTNQQGYALVASGHFEERPVSGLEITDSKLNGGCDNDVYLERGEHAKLSITLENKGKIEVSSGSLEIWASHKSEIPTKHARLPEKPLAFAALKPGGKQTLSIPIALDAVEKSVCGKKLVLTVKALSKEGFLASKDIEITLDRDIDQFKQVFCQEGICFPLAEVQSVEPSTLTPGQTIPSMKISGKAFHKGGKLSLGDGVTFDGLEFVSDTELKALKVKVADNVQPGTRDVVFEGKDGQKAVGKAALQILDTGCSCQMYGNQGEVPIWWALLICYFVIILRGRYERSTA